MNNKRRILIIVIALTMILVFSSTSYAGSTEKYDPEKAAAYAIKWADKYNPNYKRISDDCTNFISQCVVAGGAGFVKPKRLDFSTKEWLKGWKCTYDKTRWYNKPYKIKKVGIKKTCWCFSSTFTFVDDFYNFWKKQPDTKVYGTYTSCSKNSKLQNDLRLGDIVQVRDNGVWHHSIIITGGSKGNWKFCCHTSSVKNKPLCNYFSGANFRIIRIG